MSIPDEVIMKYFELASSKNPEELAVIRKRLEDKSTNPSHIKRELAKDLVTQYCDGDSAEKAEAIFDRIHVQHDVPDDIAQVHMSGETDGVWIVKALTGAKLCKSGGEARRMIKQGAVSVDGEKIADIELRLTRRDDAYTIKVGKRRFAGVHVDE